MLQMIFRLHKTPSHKCLWMVPKQHKNRQTGVGYFASRKLLSINYISKISVTIMNFGISALTTFKIRF